MFGRHSQNSHRNHFDFFLDTRIRARVFNSLKVKFPRLEDAEEFYNLTLSNCLNEMEQAPAPREVAAPQSPAVMVDKIVQTTAHKESVEISATSTNIGTCKTFSADIAALISSLDEAQLTELANLSFLKMALKSGIDSNPADFASLSVNAMKKLQEQKKNNLVYKFAFCIAQNRPGSDETFFPLDRMPFGLVEYQIEFFLPPMLCRCDNFVLRTLI